MRSFFVAFLVSAFFWQPCGVWAANEGHPERNTDWNISDEGPTQKPITSAWCHDSMSNYKEWSFPVTGWLEGVHWAEVAPLLSSVNSCNFAIRWGYEAKIPDGPGYDLIRDFGQQTWVEADDDMDDMAYGVSYDYSIQDDKSHLEQDQTTTVRTYYSTSEASAGDEIGKTYVQLRLWYDDGNTSKMVTKLYVIVHKYEESSGS